MGYTCTTPRCSVLCLIATVLTGSQPPVQAVQSGVYHPLREMFIATSSISARVLIAIFWGLPMSRLLRVFAILWVCCIPLAANAQNTVNTGIDLVYFGGPDCPFCRGWETFDLPKLKDSALFKRVRFTKVAKTIKSPVPSAFWFPDEIKDLRDPIAEKLQGSGSPMFAILNNKQVVASWKGTKKSPEEILSIIEKQPRSSSSGTTPNE